MPCKFEFCPALRRRKKMRRLHRVKAPHLTISKVFILETKSSPFPSAFPSRRQLLSLAVHRQRLPYKRPPPQSARPDPSPCSGRAASARSAPSSKHPAPNARVQNPAAPTAVRRPRRETSGKAPQLRRPLAFRCSSLSLPPPPDLPHSLAPPETSVRYTRTSCSSAHTRTDTAASQ